jgi:ABC-type antimicrobial peptide transport system permease subunit
MPGIALGLLVAAILGRVVAHPALEASVVDVSVASAVALSMIFAALIAVALPSVRAAAVRPASILRGEPMMSSWWQRHGEDTRP